MNEGKNPLLKKKNGKVIKDKNRQFNNKRNLSVLKLIPTHKQALCV